MHRGGQLGRGEKKISKFKKEPIKYWHVVVNKNKTKLSIYLSPSHEFFFQQKQSHKTFQLCHSSINTSFPSFEIRTIQIIHFLLFPYKTTHKQWINTISKSKKWLTKMGKGGDNLECDCGGSAVMSAVVRWLWWRRCFVRRLPTVRSFLASMVGVQCVAATIVASRWLMFHVVVAWLCCGSVATTFCAVLYAWRVVLW